MNWHNRNSGFKSNELFADDVKSIYPPLSPYFGYAEGKAAARKKVRTG
jgi:hypothetical protein